MGDVTLLIGTTKGAFLAGSDGVGLRGPFCDLCPNRPTILSVEVLERA